GGPWCRIPEGKPGAGVVIKDAIADITLQQVLTRPDEFDVIATPNLNGDYLSDALAAQVGGIGIAPGGNINYVTGHAIFEATHGTAPKYANQDKVNPGSVILSGEMMLRHMGWGEAADLVVKGMDGAISAKTVTYDFARLMEGATEVKCSEFGDRIIASMESGNLEIWKSGNLAIWKSEHHEEKSYGHGRRRQRRRDGRSRDGQEGARRRRLHRYRRSEGAGRRARHVRGMSDRGVRRADHRGRRRRGWVEGNGELRRRRRDLGRAAQARHEPRRSAERELQDHAVGHRADRQVLAPHDHRAGGEPARLDVSGSVPAQHVPAPAPDRAGAA